MCYYLDCLLHFLSSHSRHGTHSPFVYDLADKAIYRGATVQTIAGGEKIKQNYKTTLLRILNHLHVRSIGHADADTLIFAAGSVTEDEINQALDMGKIIVVDGIYQDSLSKTNWKTIAALPNVIVAIDLFYFGLLIRREGQVKENFKLRYPFWIK